MNAYALIRPLLFRLNPETAHNVSLGALRSFHRLGMGFCTPSFAWKKPVTVMGLDFPNPLGLAAGLDKDGEAVDGLGAMGFGFLELGTVTPRPQPGNPRPRLFRLVEQQAILNRMGFNNLGVQHLVDQVRNRRYRGLIGVNIGKNADTPLERAPEDYRLGMRAAFPVADYIAVNISSPNTQGLRGLQSGDALRSLLDALAEERGACETEFARRVPLAVKIAPDLEPEGLEAFVQQISGYPVDAVIATNTTLARPGLQGSRWEQEAGGLSGAPLTQRSTEVIRSLRAILPEAVAVIGAGGILSGQDAQDKIEAGASLIQIYSGLIYRGPALIREIASSVHSQSVGHTAWHAAQ